MTSARPGTADRVPRKLPTPSRELTALSSCLEDTLVQMELVSTRGRVSGSRRSQDPFQMGDSIQCENSGNVASCSSH